MTRRRLLTAGCILFGFFLLVIAGCFFLLQSASFVNSVASAAEKYTGYRVRLQEISVDRHLQARLRGLEVRDLKGDKFSLFLASADVSGRMAGLLRVEVDNVVLSHPKFVFQVKKESEGPGFFAALEGMPPVRLLVMKEGELELRTADSHYSLPGVNLTVRNFSPQRGGNLHLDGQVNMTSPGITGAGVFKGEFDMARFGPDPYGRGSATIMLSSAVLGPLSLKAADITSKMRIEGDKVFLDAFHLALGTIATGSGPRRMEARDVHLAMQLSYDQKSARFLLSGLQGSGAGIGSLEGKCEGSASPFTWLASFRAGPVDLPAVFTLVRPFLPEAYQSWKFKGRGALEVHTDGRMEPRPIWKADALLDLAEGGFASGDNLKAGERITGKIHLLLSSPESEQKGAFHVAMDAGVGELLWGKYYRDFKGEKMAGSSSGSFTSAPFSLSMAGNLDFFGSGRYSFSTELSPGKSALSFEGKDVSHKRLFALLLADYAGQTYQIRDADVEGESEFRVSATFSPERQAVRGFVAIRDGAVRVPSRDFSLTGFRLSLPFDMTYPPSPPVPIPEAEGGLLSFVALDAGSIRAEGLSIPLLLTQNTLLIPQQIDLPFFRGTASLTHLRLDNILSPDMRLDAGLVIDKVDLEALTERLLPVTVSGTLEGALPSITCQDGAWKTSGSIKAQVFGGLIEAYNIRAGNVTSAGRSFGANIGFDDIDLQEVTSRIQTGRMTGIVKGSIQNISVEYGQPARFVLNVETDTTKKDARMISVDAIENLSIVSTGSSAISSILHSGLNRFFKQYPYSRIGLQCILENDVFSLRGTVREGGKEYLVRRAFLRGIDVVNQNPQNSISFKDMQERLSRIMRPRRGTENVSRMTVPRQTFYLTGLSPGGQNINN